MKKYYINYYRDFGNTYNLMYVENEADEKALPDSAERITRKQAERYCRDELYAQATDPAFSGYASTSILPASFDGTMHCPENDRHLEKRGYIWERI